MEKAQAIETAFSIGINLSAYFMLPGYLQNLGREISPAKANIALYQPTYTALQQQQEPIEQIIKRKIRDGLTAVLSQIQQTITPKRNKSDNLCYLCNQPDHFTRNCRQRSFKGNNSANNYNNRDQRNVSCFNCGRNGHIARNCRAPRQNNRSNGQNNQSLN